MCIGAATTGGFRAGAQCNAVTLPEGQVSDTRVGGDGPVITSKNNDQS